MKFSSKIEINNTIKGNLPYFVYIETNISTQFDTITTWTKTQNCDSFVEATNGRCDYVERGFSLTRKNKPVLIVDLIWTNIQYELCHNIDTSDITWVVLFFWSSYSDNRRWYVIFKKYPLCDLLYNYYS